MSVELSIMIMSGVDDGSLLRRSVANGDGAVKNGTWTVTIGRHDNNDICLNNDTFVSRYHAQLRILGRECWLLDTGSTNGTYVEATSSLSDNQITEMTRLKSGQLFRVGRTWLRVEAYE